MNEEITIKEEYYNNGNIKYRFNYKNGKWYGLCEWWSNGNLILKGYYFKGKEVTEFEFDVLETCGELSYS